MHAHAHVYTHAVVRTNMHTVTYMHTGDEKLAPARGSAKSRGAGEHGRARACSCSEALGQGGVPTVGFRGGAV